MRQIRLFQDSDFDTSIDITANAYPGIKLVSQEEKMRAADRFRRMSQDPEIHFYGLFERDDGGQEQLLGMMRYHDFTMNLLSTEVLMGGAGGVAVHLLHKKKKVGRDLLLQFLRHYRQQGSCIAALYPFRPDFYQRMGFGPGTKSNQYRLKPSQLPKGPSKSRVIPLHQDDAPAIKACYDRFMAENNGLLKRNQFRVDNMFANSSMRGVGVQLNGRLAGYMLFIFRPLDDRNFLRHELAVLEFVYETPEALSQLLTFLHSQADQVEIIEFNTQDEELYHLLPDPRDDSDKLLPLVWHQSNTQGVGIMYRIIDVVRLFDLLAARDFGGQSCRLKLTITDSFLPENAGSTTLHFQDGRCLVKPGEDSDIEVKMDISHFSSMVVGSASFKRLFTYGLAQISDPDYVETVNRIFKVDQKPICMTAF